MYSLVVHWLAPVITKMVCIEAGRIIAVSIEAGRIIAVSIIKAAKVCLTVLAHV